ncbi:MAG: 3-dehydroquinate synthase [Bacteroidetes bacterium]|nr:3-dehydroquinate synthase [Bacteroidota bacterium]
MNQINSIPPPVIGSETAYESLDAFLSANSFSRIFIVVDENTLSNCLPRLMHETANLEGAEIIELESGEANKDIEVCTQVWRVLGELGADRKSLIVNLGGGVITDLGGFVAATYKRGIAFVNVPTTLLAMIDAACGGKTGIDLDGLKNEVGVFAHARGVFIDPHFLHTLPKRELLSGFAEAFKHALIADAAYWQLLCTTDPANAEHWEEIIARSVAIKQAVTDADPFEKDLRRVLNFGHTVGHALETFFLEQSQSTLLHGEAVAAGMICETLLSVKYAGLDALQAAEITAQIAQRFPHVHFDASATDRLVELMRHDKKNEDGSIRLSLLTAIGKPVCGIEVNAADLIAAMNQYRTDFVI